MSKALVGSRGKTQTTQRQRKQAAPRNKTRFQTRLEAQTRQAQSEATALAQTPAEPLHGRSETIADTIELATMTLQAICRDATSPAGARAQAARTLLELAGALKNGADTPQKAVSEMTIEELDSRLAALSHDGA
jgi:hypothetical protein